MSLNSLLELKLQASVASELTRLLQDNTKSASAKWGLVVELLNADRSAQLDPSDFRNLWKQVFSDHDASRAGVAPIWVPDQQAKQNSNLAKWIRDRNLNSYDDFFQWSSQDRVGFWQDAVDRLKIAFRKKPEATLIGDQVESAQWFPGAELNIIDSCFLADPSSTAIVFQRPGQPLQSMSYGELRQLTNRVSQSLLNAGFQAGDAIAVVMPMTAMSVPIYLGIVQAGMAAVSIADSFAAREIANRLRISNARAVVTYDAMLRAGKSIPLYQRVAEATEIRSIVLPLNEELSVSIREQDLEWNHFLVETDGFESAPFPPDHCINILFSSGTTGDPKAIPWNQLTPFKCATDGMIHQDIHPGHVVVWPTNLGWMMGPWLIFAALINRATVGLYEDAPMGAGFGEFIQNVRANMLGVVPTIVKAWRNAGVMEQYDWSSINVFSSTGETSHPDDMFYLSSLAGMRPIIEYCGGTEIGGGYITSTVMQPNAPSVFSTPAAGLDFEILNPEGEPADEGEIFLVPPSIGLSQTLLNRDHHETYFAETPTGIDGRVLRRHGDHFRKLPGGYFVAGGRVDDTMNLGGIKVSSAEIERILNQVEGVKETAAVALAADHGPEQLVVFLVPDTSEAIDLDSLLPQMNAAIKGNLNPLFKIHQVHVEDQLPRTASNKVMRRKLRDALVAKTKNA